MRGSWIRVSLLLLFMFLFISLASVGSAATVLSVGHTMNFGTPTLSGGVYTYANVFAKDGITVDAKISLTVSNATLVNIDQNANPARFEPVIKTTSGQGNILFRVDFVDSDSGLPVQLTDFYLTVVDLDGNSAAVREFVEISGYASYEVDATTGLGIAAGSNGRTRFTGISTSLPGVTFDNTASFIANYTAPVSSLDVVLGITGTATDRQFSVNFGLPGGVFSTPRSFPNPSRPTITVAIDDGGDGMLTMADDLAAVPISGTTTAEPGQPVTIAVTDSANDTVYASATVQAGGTYAGTADLSGLADGTITVSATVVDSQGNPSAPATATTTKRAIPPAIAITSSATTGTRTPTITGTTGAPDGTTVTVVINGETYTTTATDGLWAVTVPAGDALADGTYPVVASVSDTLGNTGTANQNLTVSIFVNVAPSFTKGSDQEVSEDAGAQTVANWATAISPGPASEAGQSLTFHVSNDNNGLFAVQPAIDATGNLTYTPKADAHGTATVTVTLQDDGGTANGGVDTSESQDFTITVTPVNDAPTLGAIGDQEIDELTLLTFTAVGSDVDLPDDELTYSLISAPVGASISSATGIFTWTPQEDQDGVHTFTVRVTDEAGLFAEEVITVTVHEVNVPPVLATIGNKSAVESVKLTFTVSATDSDLVVGVPNTLTYSAVDLPTGATFDAATQIFTWTPAGNQVGAHNVTFEVSDGTATVQEIVAITVSPAPASGGSDLPPPMKATLTLTAVPAAIAGDGASTSTLEAVLVYSDGSPVVGTSVQFQVTAGRLTASGAVTGADGTARVTLTAPLIEGVTPRTETAKVVVRDEAKGIVAEATVAITFLPASVHGVVVDGTTGRPIPNAIVKVQEDFDGDGVIDFTAEVTTGADGRYTILVPRGNWTYRLEILVPVMIDGKRMMVKQVQTSKVGQLTGGGGTIHSSRQIGGQLLMVGSPGKGAQEPNRVLTMGTKITGEIRTSAGAPTPFQVKVNPDGSFDVLDVAPGQYQLLFTVTAPTGERLAGIKLNATVSSEGELAVTTGLIDPYGQVTDALTGKPVQDVVMKLYWADTPLNVSKGRAPNTLVSLPILPDFAPNQNRVPQSTTADGEYAWMVWPDGDYYIVAEREGYQTYDSRVEGRTVAVKPGEDSYVQNGIIHVGESIVEYSLAIQPIGTVENGGTEPGPSEESLPALLPKPERPQSGDHVRYILGYPDKSFGPQRSVTRAEVATVIARILNLPVEAPVHDIYPDVASGEWYAGYIAATAKVGIMQGYPDGLFRPNAPITRAEIATVMARLRGFDPAAGTAFTDMASHWAEGYVVAAMDGELVKGYPDGSFRPDAHMTRAEFVTGINRLLNRGPLFGRPAPTWPDVPESYWAYGDVEEASTNHAFEAAPGPTERWLQDNP